MSFISFICPSCNKSIQIDDSCEFAFCSYCGFKIEKTFSSTDVFTAQRQKMLKNLIDMGYMQLRSNDTDSALQTFNKALEIDCSDEEALFGYDICANRKNPSTYPGNVYAYVRSHPHMTELEKKLMDLASYFFITVYHNVNDPKRFEYAVEYYLKRYSDTMTKNWLSNLAHSIAMNHHTAVDPRPFLNVLKKFGYNVNELISDVSLLKNTDHYWFYEYPAYNLTVDDLESYLLCGCDIRLIKVKGLEYKSFRNIVHKNVYDFPDFIFGLYMEKQSWKIRDWKIKFVNLRRYEPFDSTEYIKKCRELLLKYGYRDTGIDKMQPFGCKGI